MAYDEVADPERIAKIKAIPVPESRGRSLGPMTIALLEGKMIRVTGVKSKDVSSKFATVRKRGFALNVRILDDDPDAVYVWAVKKR